MSERQKKTVRETQVILARIMQPQDANPAGNVHGGTIMKLIDDASGVVAIRHARSNVVTACSDCNLRKGNRLLKDTGMTVLNEPVEPSHHLLQHHGRGYPPNFLHESWNDFLYWDAELDTD